MNKSGVIIINVYDSLGFKKIFLSCLLFFFKFYLLVFFVLFDILEFYFKFISLKILSVLSFLCSLTTILNYPYAFIYPSYINGKLNFFFRFKGILLS